MALGACTRFLRAVGKGLDKRAAQRALLDPLRITTDSCILDLIAQHGKAMGDVMRHWKLVHVPGVWTVLAERMAEDTSLAVGVGVIYYHNPPDGAVPATMYGKWMR
jgi:hypothetical protein